MKKKGLGNKPKKSATDEVAVDVLTSDSPTPATPSQAAPTKYPRIVSVTAATAETLFEDRFKILENKLFAQEVKLTDLEQKISVKLEKQTDDFNLATVELKRKVDQDIARTTDDFRKKAQELEGNIKESTKEQRTTAWGIVVGIGVAFILTLGLISLDLLYLGQDNKQDYNRDRPAPELRGRH